MKDKILFVGGTWNLNGGRSFKVIDEFRKYLLNLSILNMTAEIARIIVSRFLGEYFKNLDSETMSIGVSNNITNNK